ncbi:MAG: NFACT family protein, partial [Firmicutes bacterium]|nr:NFACT family protein [Bacillota bacterium]
MAYDGIVTCAMAQELNEKIYMGKIEKVYQPEADELVFVIHSKSGKHRLFASAGSAHARVHFISENPVNPPAPLSFCMLLRKHLQSGRITSIEQKGSERIIEISVETMNELGFSVSKKIIFEIMGKHSNIIITDIATGKIIDSIKRVSFDVNRVRQILPGMIYQYPPEQDKIPFKEISSEQLGALAADGKTILRSVGGISPAFADQLALYEGEARWEYFRDVVDEVDYGPLKAPRVYTDPDGKPVEFYPVALTDFDESCVSAEFPDMSSALEFYFGKKESSNQGR